MKKLFVLLLLSICAYNPFAAQAQTTPQKIDKGQFKFEGGETHDFGTIKRGPVAMYKFEFTNVGTKPIIITDVTPSCGCTNVDWIKSPVLPGQKGFIQLGLKTEEQHGIFNKEVYIRTDAYIPNGEKRYTLYIKGNAIDDDPKK